MELIIYFVLASIMSVGVFWIAGTFYGLIRKPSIYFPVSLAAKMAFCAVFGALMFMLGGIILSTLVFNYELSKRNDYQKWPVIISGVIISVSCTVIIYFSALMLAWQVFE